MTTNTNAALAQLRHLYANMMGGEVRDTAQTKRMAQGLLAPAIEALEQAALTTAAAVPPEGWVMVPVELAERVQESLGEFLMDHGWSQRDMDTSDEFGAVLLAADPKAEPVPAGEYPPLPTGSAWCGDDDVRDFGAGPGESALMFEPTQTQHVPLFTAGQMRAYVDADRAMRAQAAPAVGGYPVSIVNLFSKMPKMVIFPDGTFPEGCPPPPMTPENLWKVLHAASEFGGTVVWGDAHLAAPAAVAGPSEAPEGWRNKFAEAVYADLEAADNQDVPLEEYPARILKALDSIVGPRHPTVIHWRNDAIQACIAIAYKYCRDPESFQYLKQDLQALIFAAPKVAPVAQGDAKDPLAGAAQWLLQAIDGCNISDLQSHLKIGFNRAERLMQDALAARSQAKEGA